MCGIIAVVSFFKYVHAVYYILEGLKLLQNRGYDSAGISMIKNKEIITEKNASTDKINAIEMLERNLDKFEGLNTGIGHTRWATHGGKTDYNSHPHSDMTNQFTLVHNGIIENYRELKNMLTKNDFTFRSETDSEVIVNLISYNYMKTKNIEQSIIQTMENLEGTYAVAVANTIDNKVYVFCHGSPIVVGYNEEKKIAIASSESLGFGNLDLKYSFLQNGELVILEQTGKITFIKKESEKEWKHRETKDIIETSPRNYSTWCEKEINEQAEAVERAINFGGRIKNNCCAHLGGLESKKEKLKNINHLVLLGCGTSLHAGLASQSIFRKISGFETVQCFDGGDFTLDDVPKNSKIGFIFLSQSGETKDLHRCIELLKTSENSSNYVKIGVINVVESMIAREMDCGVYLNCGREVSVASTKSFTNMVVVLNLIAVWFSELNNMKTKEIVDMRKNIIQSILVLPDQIRQVLDKKIPETFIEFLGLHSSMFLLGKNLGESVALEGALKLKEISYIHAEGKSATSLKHGPFALITNKLPVLFIQLTAFGDEAFTKTENSYIEVKARDSYPFVISDNKEKCNYANFIVPYNKYFGHLLANIVIQRIALSLSLYKKINPDFPRNLAKVVTVE